MVGLYKDPAGQTIFRTAENMNGSVDPLGVRSESREMSSLKSKIRELEQEIETMKVRTPSPFQYLPNAFHPSSYNLLAIPSPALCIHPAPAFLNKIFWQKLYPL